jgi:AP-1 complex subunit gamma-1
VISKECALIRTAIKEEQEQFRHRNVAKLMYIHMLGYPTHFGQMECLKLISAPSFPEKRIGYLALTLLLTESNEVLTLVTNSLKIDLGNHNQSIQALSLIAIGNLATQDMARDLASDVEKIIVGSNSYLRKKAALAAIRLIRKEPDLIEHMADKFPQLLKDRSHGVLIAALQLINETITINPSTVAQFRELVPTLVRLLRNFISMGYSPEHDVGGIADPFLQVQIVRLLRVLGKGNDEASDTMNDVLAQVATNTETTKNAGNAILYECVQTIMDVHSDSGLRVLAVNILGRFLLNRDNNIRYVALNTLSKVVLDDVAAVQRHRSTIVDCLKDTDVSIRQRALELIYQLVNEQNVEGLTTEMLNYLVVAPSEHRPNLVAKIMAVAEKFSPSHKWRVDTIITMLTVAGRPESDDDTTNSAILFISQASGLYAYATHRLFRSVEDDSSQLCLVHVALWCIGEYAETLASPYSDGVVSYTAQSEQAVINLIEKCLRMHNAEVTTKAFGINALMKCTTRFSPGARRSIEAIIASFQGSMSLELQQRSVEYSTLLKSQWDLLRGELLAKMPVLDEETMKSRRAVYKDGGVGAGLEAMKLSSGAGANLLDGGAAPARPVAQPAVAKPAASGNNFLLDLDDIFGGGAPAPAPAPPVPQAFGSPVVAPAAPQPASNVDLLADIFGASPAPIAAAPIPAAAPMGGGFGGGMDLLGGFPAAPAPVSTPAFAPAPAAGPVMAFAKAYETNRLVINMELVKPNPADPSMTKIICKFANISQMPLLNFSFQAAVPKYLKLEILPPSSTTIPGNSNGAVTQEIRVTNSMQGEKPIMLKLKINYNYGGKPVEELGQAANIPPGF